MARRAMRERGAKLPTRRCAYRRSTPQANVACRSMTAALSAGRPARLTGRVVTAILKPAGMPDDVRGGFTSVMFFFASGTL